MFGLIVFGALGLYLVLLFAATWWGYRYAAKKGLPRRKRWLWAAGGFLLVYLPVFWDWIPTVVAQKYYCTTASGFWIYKTLDQWKSENPGVMDTLVQRKDSHFSTQGNTSTYILNQRMRWVLQDNAVFALLPVFKHQQEVVDGNSNAVIARYIDFSTGYNGWVTGHGGWEGLKFWLVNEHCPNGAHNQDALRNFRNEFVGAEK